MQKPTNPQETIKFIAFLEEALQCVDAWTPTSINEGGCGEFALLFSEELDRFGIEHKIVGLKLTDKEIELNGVPKDKINSAYSHYCIKVGDLYFDSTGLINGSILHCGRELFLLTKDVLQANINDKDIWNPIYDHECDAFIKQKLDEVFDAYESYEPGKLTFPKKNEVVLTKHTVKNKRSSVDPIAAFAELFQNH